ncbi:hypothetical protein AB6A40_006784 [Gnathostoma spinigerum]|uniref:Kynureninase n=1 Tax=Gnathostoma spinigerum TaxID=75299 RepID=A0ABD6EJC1_9BILA
MSSSNKCNPYPPHNDIRKYLKDVGDAAGIKDWKSYEMAVALDSNDPLRHLREEFFIPKMETIPHADLSLVDAKAESIYLCGNSLGLMPKATKKYMDQQFKKWAEMGVCGHFDGPLPWSRADEIAAEKVAKLVGAEPCEVVLMNGLTVNLHILLTSFYHPTPERHKILLESKAFPSDHYAIESQIKLKGGSVEASMICMEPRENEDCLRMEDILSLIEQEGETISLIMFSGVQYYTGQLFDIRGITNAGHRKGCLVGWDLAHSFCNVPLELHDWNVDFAVWCTYKYGCSSAGGLGGMFLHSKYMDDKRDRMVGWWGHCAESRMIMNNQLELDRGARGYRISNPPMMLVVPLLGMLDVYSMTNLDALRSRSIYLTGYLEYLLNSTFGPDSVHSRNSTVTCKIITPSDPEQRGCQLSLKFNIDIKNVCDALMKRGVVIDKRYPHVIRVTPTHIYNNFSDVHRFVSAISQCLTMS